MPPHVSLILVVLNVSTLFDLGDIHVRTFEVRAHERTLIFLLPLIPIQS